MAGTLTRFTSTIKSGENACMLACMDLKLRILAKLTELRVPCLGNGAALIGQMFTQLR